MKKLSKRKKLEQELKVSLPPLIDKIKNGDSSAKEELTVLILPYIRIVINKFAKSLETLDSLAGWIAFRIVSKAHKIDTTKSVIGYVVRSATNYCLDQLKYNSAKKRVPDQTKLLNVITYSSVGNQSETLPDTIKFLIESSFNEVDSKILISYINGVSIPDISVLSGQPEDYVIETVQTAGDYL